MEGEFFAVPVLLFPGAKQRNGQPVDTTATLAIVFQLAY